MLLVRTHFPVSKELSLKSSYKTSIRPEDDGDTELDGDNEADELEEGLREADGDRLADDELEGERLALGD